MDIKEVIKTIEVTEKEGSVEILFPEGISRELVKNQLNECKSGGCSCCSDAFKERVTDLSTEETDKGIVAVVKGDVSKEQIEKNVLSCVPTWIK